MDIHSYGSLLLLVLAGIPLCLTLHLLSSFLSLLIRQRLSPLRLLPGPPSPSFFLGNLREMHDQENNNLIPRWQALYGDTFVYRGFLGGYRLMTTDPVAVSHILGHAYDFPKPEFVRDALASMAAGHEGILIVEGEDHKRQRKILTPAFTAAHIRSLSPIFWKKAVELRTIWLDAISSPTSVSSLNTPQASDPLASPAPPPQNTSESKDHGATSSVVKFLNPFAHFVSSKRLPTASLVRRRVPPEDSKPRETSARSREGVKIDVLAWFARATLDVIGLAGFGYNFDSLHSSSREAEDELAQAFGVIFSAARKFRVMTILMLWFPFLRRFRQNSAVEEQALATMRRIGLGLIDERIRGVKDSSAEVSTGHITAEKSVSEKAEVDEGGKDILSVLVRSNLSSNPSARLSTSETLCQISTLIAAGHETTASALTWALYALARDGEGRRVQRELRRRLRADVPWSFPPSDMERKDAGAGVDMDAIQVILNHPYLDATLRECLRLYSPITTTMRVADHDGTIPLSPLPSPSPSSPSPPSSPTKTDSLPSTSPTRREIKIKKGDILSIPIQIINKRFVRGGDGERFWPERWMIPEDELPPVHQHQSQYTTAGGGGVGGVQGLWAGMLTFLNGNPVNGNRACIGYRFALNEIKIFLYVLLRDIEFTMDSGVEIEKRVNVVTRPCVKNEPEVGNQMPLVLRYVPPDEV